ncbi:MAPEG family protein [Alsobacter sp. KACC 23698]|uniref:MAPEG family protein n=1 Tax=Alsobacter sp. KACC 23698 TaxID=3149229 RepID=A0AAU7JES6_9HYPH
MTVTPVYAALLAFLFIALSARVIVVRRSLKVAIGAGGHPALERAMRVHANFAEYAPLGLILLAFCEMKGAPSQLVVFYGAALLAGRLSHAWGVSQAREDFRFRMVGMVLTFAVLGAMAATLLALSAR